MAAQRPAVQTKTVPLNGGLQDDVVEMLQESPTLTKSRNTRYDKQGEVRKCLPYDVIACNESGTPVVMSSAANSVYALDSDGDIRVYEDGKADWQTVENNGKASRNEVLQAMAPAVGGSNYTFMDSPDGTYRMVAWEQRRPNAHGVAIQTQCDVIIEVYNPATGVKLDRLVVNAFNPQVIDPGDGPRCYAVTSAGAVNYYYWDVPTQDIIGSATGVIDCLLDFDRSLAMDVPDRDALRPGACEDGGRQGEFVVAGDIYDQGASPLWGAIIWKSTVDQSIQSCRLWPSGGLNVPTKATLVSAATVEARPLDVSVWGNEMSCIYAYDAEDGAGVWDFHVHGHIGDVSVTPVTWEVAQELRTPGRGTSVNGSVACYNGWSYFAFTNIMRDAEEPVPGYETEDYQVTAGVFQTATVNEYETLHNHRLASKIVKTPGRTDALTCVVEQAISTSAKTTTAGINFLPVALKGVTPVLMDMYDGTNGTCNYILRSAYDVVQSRQVSHCSAEQANHLPNLYNDSTNPNFQFINRVQLQPEDFNHQYVGTDATYNKRTAILHPGEFKGIIYNTTQAVITDETYAVPVGENSIINSSIPLSFDGALLGELSPLDQPEITFFRISGDIAEPVVFVDLPVFHQYEQLGGDPDKYRTIQVVTGYADANGQIHRSAPSFPVFAEYVTSYTADNNNLWRTVGWTMPLTYFGTDRHYFAEIYVGSGSAEPQLAATKSIDMGTPSSAHQVITFLDTHVAPSGYGADAVRFSEVVYSAGNVLVADPWPNFDDFVITSNRLFAVGSTNHGTVYYSKLFEENLAPEFSAALTIPLGRSRRLQAIGKIDDKVIVFTKDEIFAIYGTGPDNTGANGDFIVDRLQTAFGCEDPQSLVEIPDGLAFYSRRSGEFHLISRDLQINDIGKGVMDASSALNYFQGAFVVPDQHEIRWHAAWYSNAEFGNTEDTSTGTPARPPRPRYLQEGPPTGGALVYNYHHQKWSIQHPHAGGASLYTVHNGRPNSLTSSWDFRIESNSRLRNNWTTSEDMVIETPWIRVANLQSYGRIDELVLIGKYYSAWWDYYNTGVIEAGDLKVELFYDYHESASGEEYIFRANAGDFGTVNSLNDRLQISVHPGQPKCQAIKLRLTEQATVGIEVSEPTYSAGEGMGWIGLDILWSPKSGTGTKTLPARSTK